MRAFVELLRPEPTADGFESEERLVFCGVSWERYLALGDDRPGPRFYYLNGELEIMTTSNEHERIKKWIGDLMAVYFEEADIEIMPRGQATMRKALSMPAQSRKNRGVFMRKRSFPISRWKLLSPQAASASWRYIVNSMCRRSVSGAGRLWKSSSSAAMRPLIKPLLRAGCFRVSTLHSSSAAWQSVPGSRLVAPSAPA